jgi:hypothetical protein
MVTEDRFTSLEVLQEAVDNVRTVADILTLGAEIDACRSQRTDFYNNGNFYRIEFYGGVGTRSVVYTFVPRSKVPLPGYREGEYTLIED